VKARSSGGQHDGEAGSFADRAGDDDGAAMLLDDAVGDREAQSRALVATLGGEDGLEDAYPDLVRDARSVVLDP